MSNFDKFKKIDPSDVIFRGSDFSIENKEFGTIYLSNKKYLDKLCGSMGYRNLNVIKILDEFAGKVISSVGSIGTQGIYTNDDTSSFIVVSNSGIEWYNKAMKELEEEYEIYNTKSSDTYLSWDCLCVKNKVGSEFVIYTDLVGENAYIFSLHYTDETLDGMNYEGKFKFEEGDDSYANFFNVLKNTSLASKSYYSDEQMSVREACELLDKLGYLEKSRKKYYLSGKSVPPSFGSLEDLVDSYNSSNWLIRCLTPFSNFNEAFKLISLELPNIDYWSISSLYSNNDKGESDITLLKSIK